MKQTNIRLIVTSVAMIASILASGTALAANITWTTCTAGLFDDVACWAGGVIPDTADTAVLTGPPANFTVRWNASTLANWNGATGNALAEVTNTNLTLAANSAEVTLLSDPGSGAHSYRLTGDISVNGGQTLNLGSAIPANADPINVIAGSVISVGNSGAGTLNIRDGSTLAGGLVIIDDSASVSGVGSTWTSSGGFEVARSHTATLTIADGGTVSSASGYIGRLTGGGTATITGAGSLWTMTGLFRVGWQRSGVVDIVSGGAVTSANGELGATFGNGTVTVGDSIGLSRWTNAGDLAVGGTNAAAGTGTASTLTVNAGGEVAIGGLLKTWSAGTVNLNGGAITAGSVDFSLGAFTHTDGTLIIDGGTFVGPGVDLVVDSVVPGSNPSLVLAAGASASVTGNTIVGNSGNGTLTITAGSLVTNTTGVIGSQPGSAGVVTVTGAGSQWNSAGDLIVGEFGTGTLDLFDQGEVIVGGNIVNGSGVGTVNVDGGVLSVAAGIDVDNFNIGNAAGTSGNHTVGAGQELLAGTLNVGNSGTGTLNVEAGGGVSNANSVVGREADSTGTVTVTGGGSLWNTSFNLIVGNAGTGTLDVEAGGVVSSIAAFIGNEVNATGLVTVAGIGSRLNPVVFLHVAERGTGTLQVEAGGVVSNGDGSIGNQSGSTGNVTVTGAGSQWNGSGDLIVGEAGNGTLLIEDGGTVMSGDGFIGRDPGSNGLVTIANAGSIWSTSGALYVGGSDLASGGAGVLNVNTGGSVDVASNLTIRNAGTVNLNGGTLSAATVVTAGGMFNFNGGVLNIGDDFVFAPGEVLGASFTLTANQAINVAGATTFGPLGSLTIAGGTFSTGVLSGSNGIVHISGLFNLTDSNLVIGGNGQFGDTMQLASAAKINVNLDTVIENDGLLVVDNTALSSGNYTNNGEILLTRSTARLKGGNLDNAGLVHGDGRVETTLTNEADGEVRVRNGERLLFTGASNTNVGEINILDGTVDFSQHLTNKAGGFIAGRGVLNVNGGLDNQGVVAFTGTTDIFGDVDNNAAGRILVSGISTLTFFDDVVHNGAELRASAGSNLVFLGGFSGSGGGLVGDFFLEGDLRPGNSPGLLEIDGDLTFGALLTTEIELGGLDRITQYDAVDVTGTLTLGGTLNVVLVDLGGGLFNPEVGSSFDIFDAGSIFGSFAGINLPGLQAGLQWDLSQLGTNGLLSVTAVPLPPAIWLFLSALLGVVAVRRKST